MSWEIESYKEGWPNAEISSAMRRSHLNLLFSIGYPGIHLLLRDVFRLLDEPEFGLDTVRGHDLYADIHWEYLWQILLCVRVEHCGVNPKSGGGA